MKQRNLSGNLLQRIVLMAGLPSARQYIIIALIMLFTSGFITVLFFNLLAAKGISGLKLYLLPIIVMGLTVAILVVWPYTLISNRNNDIQEKIHLFVTYLGTLSTANVSRAEFFHIVSEAEQYGLLTDIMRRIYHLAAGWGLGYSQAAYSVAKIVPNKIYSSFLSRFAHAMEAGEPIDEFLLKEQKVVMDDYRNAYDGTLRNIGMFSEMYISLTVAVSFITGLVLLVPSLLGLPAERLFMIVMVLVIFTDTLFIFLLRITLPNDPLYHGEPVEPKEYKMLRYHFIALLLLCILIFVVLFRYTELSLIINFAFSSTPLLYVGYKAKLFEDYMTLEDENFSRFLRTLGGTLAATGSTITNALNSIRIHDFEYLNQHIENLYRRLVYSKDIFKSWYWFSIETGSFLIHKFSNVFVETIYKGGDAKLVSQIIGDNFNVVRSLRKLRASAATNTLAIMFGATFGLALTVYLSFWISETLFSTFRNMQSDIMDQWLPNFGKTDTSKLIIYADILMFIHCMFASVVMTYLRGGVWYTSNLFFSLLLYLVALMSWGVPRVVSRLIVMPGGG